MTSVDKVIHEVYHLIIDKMKFRRLYGVGCTGAARGTYPIRSLTEIGCAIEVSDQGKFDQQLGL